MKGSPTHQDLLILAFVIRYRKENGYSPCIREILVEFGLSSTSAMSYRLKRLERNKLLKVQEEISRGIVVPGEWVPDPRILSLLEEAGIHVSQEEGSVVDHPVS